MNQKGFTLTEFGIFLWFVVAVVFVLAVAFAVFYVAPTMNIWFTEPGVLKAIQVDHPEADKIIVVTREVWRKAKIIVENKDGTRSVYLLDTCVLFNYDLEYAHDVPSPDPIPNPLE